MNTANFSATSDLYFSWSRNISFITEGTEVAKEPINLVATSSRFGLVFAAAGSVIKCTTIADILREHSIDKNLPDSTNHVFLTAPAGGIINGLFVSADETTVAACVESGENSFCHMFDVKAFSDKTPHPIGPYFTLRLSPSQQVSLADFAFNPVIPDMFAAVTSDGIVTNYEIASNNGQFSLRIHGTYSGITCCSWSPKGKQLVVGKTNGNLVQLKHNMVEAKTIAPPSLPELPNPKVKSIYWASSTVFVVAYWTDRIHVLVLMLQKNAPMTYAYFDEPCLRNLEQEKLCRTWFCPVIKCNQLIMVCRNSPDVALFGYNEDRSSWVYYDIEAERAASPIVNKQHTYPTGVCISYASTAPVEKKNDAPKPAAPVLLLSNTGGSLTPYHLINCTSSESICSPCQGMVEALSTNGMRKMLNPLEPVQKLAIETPLAAPISKFKVNLLKQFEKLDEDQSFQVKTTESTPAKKISPFAFGEIVPLQTPAMFPAAQSTPIGLTAPGGDKTVRFSEQLLQTASQKPSLPKPGFPMLAERTQEAAVSSPTKPKSLEIPAAPTAAATGGPPLPSAQTPADVLPNSEAVSQSSAKSGTEILSQQTLSKAFFNELNSVTKELEALKFQSSKVVALPIGEDKCVSDMRSETKVLLKKMDDIRSDLKAMKGDIHQAEKVLLDALACATQLKTITIAKDSRISRMDPITQATLGQAQGLAHYLERQLINANNVLDDAYEKYKNEKNLKRRVPTMEMLCRTILNCDKTIEALRDELENMRNKVDSIKRMRTLRDRANEDLTSLANSLLVVGVSVNSANKTPKTGFKDPAFDKIKSLEGYLASRPVTEVTPTKLTPHGESMIVSKLSTILEQSRIEVQAESKKAPQIKLNLQETSSETTGNSMPRESLGGFLGLRPNRDNATVTPLKPATAVTSTPFSKVVLEPISPPVDIKPTLAQPAVSTFFQLGTSGFQAVSAEKTSSAPTAAFCLPPTSADGAMTADSPKSRPAAPAGDSQPKHIFSFPPLPAKTLVGPEGFRFAAAESLAKKSDSSTPRSDFSFAIKKDASKDLLSTTKLGFALTKKEDALPSCPSSADSTSKEQANVPVADVMGTGKDFTSGSSLFGFAAAAAAAAADKKDAPKSTAGPTFTFSFGKSSAEPAPDRSDGSEKQSVAQSPASTAGPKFTGFKLGSESAASPRFNFSFGQVSSDAKSGAQLVAPGQSANKEGTADKLPLPATNFNFSLKTGNKEKTATAEVPKASPKASTSPQKVDLSSSKSSTSEASFAIISDVETSSAESAGKSREDEASAQRSESTESRDEPKSPASSVETSAKAAEAEVEAPKSTGTTEPLADQVSGEAASPAPVSAIEPVTGISEPSGEASLFAANRAPTQEAPLAAVTATAQTSRPLFGKAASGGLFGKTASGGLFGSSAVPAFGQSGAVTSSAGTSFFGGSSAATTTTSFFGGGQPATTSDQGTGTQAPPATTVSPQAFGSTTTDSSVGWMAAAPQPAAPQPAAPQPAAPQPAADTAVQAPATSTSNPTAPLFGSSIGFGQSPLFGSPTSAFAPRTSSAFASTTSATFAPTTPSAFAQSTSTAFPSTTTPAFGSTTTSAFGPTSAFPSSTTSYGQAYPSPVFADQLASPFRAQQKPQNELFGKSMAPGSGSLFGQKSTFGSVSARASLFGGSSSSPPAGGFISGLGQAGSPTTKNVFGDGAFGRNPQRSLFGSGGATSFGGPSNYASSAPNRTAPESPFSMAEQATPKPAFGGPPTFGSASPGGFGSPPTFGSAPVFGAPSAFGGSAQTSAFGNTSNTPTFGSLAQNQSPFGSPQAPSGFGAASPTQGFASAGSAPPKGAAFTQYRG